MDAILTWTCRMNNPQRRFINEYADYIQQLPQGQAGKLHPVENEKPATIRRRLAVAAKALGTNLTIKRSGEDCISAKKTAQKRSQGAGVADESDEGATVV
jgi:hypothetical protein